MADSLVEWVESIRLNLLKVNVKGELMPPRRYRTDLRTEQTAVARRRILQAGEDLFRSGGYLGTTLAQVAEAAGVSVQTVYNVVGGKAALLKAVYDTVLAGDD